MEEGFLRNPYHLFKDIANIVEKTEGKEVIVVLPQEVGTGKIRKLLEIVFHNMGIQARIRAGKKSKDEEGSRKAKGVVIVVQGSGATYADTLSKLMDKDAINTIRGVRRTANGNLLVMMSDTEGQTHKKVKEALAVRKVRVVGGRQDKTIRVRDINTLQSKEDVANVLEESLATQRDKIVIKSLKPTADRNQVAIMSPWNQTWRIA